MWIYNGLVQERITMPDTGLKKVISIKIKGKGVKAENEAYKKLNDKIRKLSYTRLLLSEGIDLYIKDIGKTLKPSSVRKARITLGSIIDVTGDAYLENITAGFIRRKFLESGKQNRTLNGYIKIFKTFWLWAYRNDLVQSKEVFDKLTPFPDTPKRERIQDKYLEPWELNELISNMKEKRWALLTEALALSGLRIGEFASLTKADVAGDYIRVNKTYDANNKVLTSAKTYSSKRDVFIQDELKDCISRINEYCKFQAEVCGYTSMLFFPDTDGGYLQYYTYRKYLREVSERVLHRKIIPHALRHTHCSVLASRGMSLESISDRLGHTDSKITKEIYLHKLQELKEKENQQLNTIHFIG